MRIEIVIPGRPITKKNSPRIMQRKNGTRFVAPSKEFEDYQERCGWYLSCKNAMISSPVNVRCVYYMPTRHRVDLSNLISATCDVLVHYGVLKDDNCTIVESHDGSRVKYDKESPRVEITIEDTKNERQKE